MEHTVPKNHGGSDDPCNLQALCFRCNACKRDSDTTDFRNIQACYTLREAGCVFCELNGCDRVLLKNELAVCIADADSVTSGHSVVIPRRHGADETAAGTAQCHRRGDKRLEFGGEFW